MLGAMTNLGFIHLRVHSAYSLLEGALPFDRLIGLARQDRMPALGLTDTGNLFGALEFAEKAAESGIQPIIGSRRRLSNSAESDWDDAMRAEPPAAHNVLDE